jgi:3-methylfumaryl-CoA hydratase
MLPEEISTWIGKEETRHDVVTSSPLSRLAALLDHTVPPWPREVVPPLGHWLYGLATAPHSDLGEDGHPKLGGFLPPLPLPRRMWASGSVEFLAPIQVGERFRKRSIIQNIRHKSGRSGELVFVTLQHEIHASSGVAIRETQDLVYRGHAVMKAPTDPATEAPLPSPDWERTVRVDPMLLFRFSAVTFNSHRIHYDRDYAVGVEGYPGLVVHGPLIATVLMDLFLRNQPGRNVATFRFRALRPLFDQAPFSIAGLARDGKAELWALRPDRQVAMRAELTYL